ncbi:uncharacterized protein K460DRAFT_411022 [Cucurbitaria berberidis CBS 394.84]|uniref:Uncharacterized protein n=1 Tax=Cucurbitaria berberidis CBS 394.84 TaxID=1168544 RepID=A0A9P4L3L2_9PLEO|nr:uncharacterized protein K460DRAFT_411022 [Cucurbitaria berberidis CBS 394.84]KAF1840439.1 hypothetical protein K460DRAFT_411022 [Cucurbitaria berberidis CBS 394.84]
MASEAASFKSYIMCDNNDSTSSTRTDAPIIEPNASTSPLLRIPSKIRNAIYSYVLTEGTYTVVGVNDTNGVTLQDAKPHHLALLSVCRQTYRETAMLPFTLNTFRFDTLKTFDPRNNFPTRPRRHAIKSLHLVTLLAPVFDALLFLDEMKRPLVVSFAEMYPNVQRVEIDLVTCEKPIQNKTNSLAKLYVKMSRSIEQRLVKWLRVNDSERRLEVVIRATTVIKEEVPREWRQ